MCISYYLRSAVSASVREGRTTSLVAAPLRHCWNRLVTDPNHSSGAVLLSMAATAGGSNLISTERLLESRLSHCCPACPRTRLSLNASLCESGATSVVRSSRGRASGVMSSAQAYSNVALGSGTERGLTNFHGRPTSKRVASSLGRREWLQGGDRGMLMSEWRLVPCDRVPKQPPRQADVARPCRTSCAQGEPSSASVADRQSMFSLNTYPTFSVLPEDQGWTSVRRSLAMREQARRWGPVAQPAELASQQERRTNVWPPQPQVKKKKELTRRAAPQRSSSSTASSIGSSSATRGRRRTAPRPLSGVGEGVSGSKPGPSRKTCGSSSALPPVTETGQTVQLEESISTRTVKRLSISNRANSRSTESNLAESVLLKQQQLIVENLRAGNTMVQRNAAEAGSEQLTKPLVQAGRGRPRKSVARPPQEQDLQAARLDLTGASAAAEASQPSNWPPGKNTIGAVKTREASAKSGALPRTYVKGRTTKNTETGLDAHVGGQHALHDTNSTPLPQIAVSPAAAAVQDAVPGLLKELSTPLPSQTSLARNNAKSSIPIVAPPASALLAVSAPFPLSAPSGKQSAPLGGGTAVNIETVEGADTKSSLGGNTPSLRGGHEQKESLAIGQEANSLRGDQLRDIGDRSSQETGGASHVRAPQMPMMPKAAVRQGRKKEMGVYGAAPSRELSGAEQITLEGTIASIMYEKEGNDFVVFKMKAIPGSYDKARMPVWTGEAPPKGGAFFKPRRKASSSKATAAEDPAIKVSGLSSRLGPLRLGQMCRLSGMWKVTEKYGVSFEAVDLEEMMPKTEGELLSHLAGGVMCGVGRVIAERMIGVFGEKVLEVLDGEDAETQLQKVPGIGPKNARKFALEWKERQWERTAIDFLRSYNIPLTAAQRLVQYHGRDVEKVIRADPWAATNNIPGWTFSDRDELARALGADPALPSRRRVALQHVLSARCSSEGHTYLPWHQLEMETAKMLEVADWAEKPSTAALAEAMGGLDGEVEIDEGWRQKKGDRWEITPRTARCYEQKLYDAEVFIAKDLKERADRGALGNDSERVAEWIWKTDKGGKTLSQEQRNAVEATVFEPVIVLTGGPGCGKTHTTRTIYNLWVAMGKEVALCAPTGRAAQKLSETVGKEALTVHRLLEYRPNGEEEEEKETTKAVGTGNEEGQGATEGGKAAGKNREKKRLKLADKQRAVDNQGFFARNGRNPLQVDAVILDEASMLDVVLAQALLEAIPPDAQILFVGDIDQLPPVGPGHVLKDIISSGQVQLFRLTEVFRQARESMIIRSAHQINRGAFPELFQGLPPPSGSNWWGEHSSQADCLWLEANDDQSILALVEEAMLKGLPERGWASKEDVQLLCPQHKGEVGTLSFNKLLQRLVNPPESSQGREELKMGDNKYRIGDRVIQTRNNYDEGIFNGDMGVIQAVNRTERSLTVNFSSSATGGKSVVIKSTMLLDIQLAWAITVHKAQGSEYPVVVLPMSSSYYTMLSRNLLYTAITRARKLVVVVGSRAAVERAVRVTEKSQRNTSLCQRLVRQGPHASSGDEGQNGYGRHTHLSKSVGLFSSPVALDPGLVGFHQSFTERELESKPLQYSKA
eukprot:TRINITY_DN23095_c0_g1_i1.p1 TRINITY_DN23095_c0_g1~~TRINITY_DN23095_c0_g1_i1.p1  ORF type:complete len:1590 (+),score=253.71 TRINITY_DN23095_c0_g1_i1:1143-5912(+)